ncbi:hypothetical protein OOT43_18805 [Methylococcus mesophilus]|nr:hypothetical protein [Methylococcus mesophilus]UZR31055.1 hypothetical protein OOT43_18805 [Methylococcus mesophilus]
MVERFNGRIADILSRLTTSIRPKTSSRTVHRYVTLYNHQLPLGAWAAKPPCRLCKPGSKHTPDLFYRKPYNWPGRDRLKLE